MPPMLREPWFLRGRKSVLLRAVLMSFVLSALSMLAGLTFRLILFVGYAGRLWESIDADDFRLIVGGLLGITSAALIGVPCSFWYGLSRIQTGLVCLFLAAACSQSSSLALTLTVALQEIWIDTDNISRDGFAMFLVLWLAWSVVDLRRLRAYPVCWSLSALVLPVIVFAMPAAGPSFAMTPLDILSVWSGGILPRLNLGESTALKATGTLLAILFVPWGIPFWFPPAAQPAETAG